MTQPDRFEGRLPDGLADLAAAQVPSYLDDILAESRRLRQRPRWTFPERWLPMTTIALPAARGRTLPSTWFLVLTGALLAILVAGVLLTGGTLLRSESAVVPAPVTGPARNGLLAFDHPSGDIWVVDPEGSDPRPFVEDPEIAIDPVWSPDGLRLAYWALEAPAILKERYEGSDLDEARNTRTASLVVVDADGRDRRVLVSGIKLDWGAMPPAWAPDGHAIVFSHVPAGAGPLDIAIDIVRTDDGRTSRVVDQGQSPTWSPDGSAIAYRVKTDDTDEVDVMVLDTREVVRVSSAPASASGFGFQLPQWSPDSRRLTYFAGPEPLDVWVAQADGSGDVMITEKSGDPAWDTHDVWPAWSPDGTRIAYFGNSGSSSLFAVVDPDGSDPVLLKGERMAMSPPTTWSPEGDRIVGFAEEADPDGSGALRLLDPSGVGDPTVVVAETLFAGNSWQRLAP
jgi:Tol biopolymer transport system component